jgi:hypothetical protein
MRKVIATAIILVCLANTAEAEEAFFITGPGVATCGRFNEEYAKNWEIEAFFYSWGQGWMSAANLALSVTAGKPSATDLGAMSMKEEMLSVRVYCEENPLKYYENAVIDLYDSMRRAQGLQGWIATLTGQ